MAFVNVPGMHGWDNPFHAVRRLWIVSVPRKRSEVAFFVWWETESGGTGRTI